MNTIKNNQCHELMMKVIDKMKISTKNNVLLTKKQIVKYSDRLWAFMSEKGQESQFETRLEKILTKKNDEYQNVLDILTQMVPFLVKNTVRLYEKGHLAAIFSEDEMTSLANQKMLDVLARYRAGKVDMLGLRSYFKTAFKNHSQKIYEAHNGTDIRGGIRTTGSDEAMNIAINMNLYTPEKQYMLQNTMKEIFKHLLASDVEYNEKLQKFNSGTLVRQNYSGIIQCLLKGNTAEETEKELDMSNADYLRQKRLAFEFLKKNVPGLLQDLFSDFEVEEDKRIHTKVVEKRTRKSAPENVWKLNFFILETELGRGKKQLDLTACVNVVDRFGHSVHPPKESNIINGKKWVIKSEVTTKNNYAQVKNNLIQSSKHADTLVEANQLGHKYLVDFQTELNTFYHNKRLSVA